MRTEQARALEEIPQFKRLHRVGIKVILGAIKEPIVLAAVGKALEDPAHLLPFLDERPQIQCPGWLIPCASMRPALALSSVSRAPISHAG